MEFNTFSNGVIEDHDGKYVISRYMRRANEKLEKIFSIVNQKEADEMLDGYGKTRGNHYVILIIIHNFIKNNLKMSSIFFKLATNFNRIIAALCGLVSISSLSILDVVTVVL